MQYFLMAAFFWMLVEGIYLYLNVVKVYNINNKMTMYYVMSWGRFNTVIEHQLLLLLLMAANLLAHSHWRGSRFRDRPVECYFLFNRFSCCRGCRFAEHYCRKKWHPEFCQWWIVRQPVFPFFPFLFSFFFSVSCFNAFDYVGLLFIEKFSFSSCFCNIWCYFFCFVFFLFVLFLVSFWM